MPSEITQQILDGLTSGIVAVNAHCLILVSNPVANEYLRANLTPGRNLHSIPAAAAFCEFIPQVIESGKAIARREAIVAYEDGTRREIGFTANPLASVSRIDGVVFLFTDMTERRILERAADLNRQLAVLGELAAGVVHELRTPVTVISAVAELIAREGEDQPDVQEKAKTILDECAAMERLVSQFLGFARPFDIERAACRPKEILDRAVKLATPKAARRHVALELDCPADLPEMEADVEKAGQALANLMNNACEAVAENAGRVAVRVRQEGVEVVFAVTDNGPGVRQPEGADVFRPFFTQKEGGTGLGLSIVSRIVSAHGGSVRWFNPPGGGACFECRIPMRPGALW